MHLVSFIESVVDNFKLSKVRKMASDAYPKLVIVTSNLLYFYVNLKT